jgi:hypothetical protein
MALEPCGAWAFWIRTFGRRHLESFHDGTFRLPHHSSPVHSARRTTRRGFGRRTSACKKHALIPHGRQHAEPGNLKGAPPAQRADRTRTLGSVSRGTGRIRRVSTQEVAKSSGDVHVIGDKSRGASEQTGAKSHQQILQCQHRVDLSPPVIRGSRLQAGGGAGTPPHSLAGETLGGPLALRSPVPHQFARAVYELRTNGL